MLLKDQLKEDACEMDAEGFRVLVRDVFRNMYPGWTDEGLGCLPREAIRYCGVVRLKADSPDMADSLILRTLFNVRKRTPQPARERVGRASVVRLADELKACGCPLDPAEFRRIIADVFHGACRGWTDEDLLCNPRDAIKYCNHIRRETSTPDASDMLILRTLTNLRRSSGLK